MFAFSFAEVLSGCYLALHSVLYLLGIVSHAYSGLSHYFFFMMDCYDLGRFDFVR